MIHPNVGNIDNYNEVFDKNIVSKNRIEEMKMAMDRGILDKVYKSIL